MKKRSEELEFYINQKRMKENREITFHKEVEIRFQGKAILLNEAKKKTDQNYKIELPNYYILNRSGKYKVIYTDTAEQLHIIYFTIRKKVPIFVFLLLFLPILASIFFYQDNRINKVIEKELQVAVIKKEKNTKENEKYYFHMYLQDTNRKNTQTINLMETVSNQEVIKNKIAPGIKGEFTIIIDTYSSTQALMYEIQVKDQTEKPNNLYFKGKNDIEYSSLEELATKELRGKIGKESQENLKIQWEWKYEISDQEDRMDVLNANQIEKYQFEILAIGKEI